MMFNTLEDIRKFILDQDEQFAEVALNAYNVQVEVIKPQTLEEHETIMWDTLEYFELV